MATAKILIADDDKNICELLKMYLEKEDYEVVTAGNGEEAIAKFDSENPDLILLDGGQGQVNAVLPIVRAFGYDIPVYGMVKDNKHRTRAIAYDGGEIAINSKRQAFTLVSTIQEEVHRFAITYHHKKHQKSSFSSSLLKIDGIGEKKAKALLKHFKTVTAIKNAEIDELCRVEGINRATAQKVYDYFRKNVDNTR